MSNVLILSNDAFRVRAKTCDSLRAACERLGHRATVRDTSDVRFAIDALQSPEALLSYRENVASKFIRLMDYLSIDTVLALDMDWLLLPDEFLNTSQPERIYSLWFDDLRTWNRGEIDSRFDGELSTEQILSHPKLTHGFYGMAMKMEAEELGLSNTTLSPLAADQKLLKRNEPPSIHDRMAFVGNPGCRQPPHPAIVEKMKNGASLQELRSLAAGFIASHLPSEAKEWIKAESSVQDLLEFCLQARCKQPFRPAMELFQIAASQHESAAQYLRKHNQLLEALLLIKLVNQYDRPALACRLHSKGMLDVYSAPEEWAPYGIESKPFVKASELPLIYQQYPAHLNAANALRDATANEKLFELSACARTSLNLRSPDVEACYGGGEILLADELDEAEALAAGLLSDSRKCRSLGKVARLRTAREHTWDHRLSALL